MFCVFETAAYMRFIIVLFLEKQESLCYNISIESIYFMQI